MPPRSKIGKLPEAVRRWVDKMLSDNDFGGLEGIVAELKAAGHDISKSSLGRYSQGVERKLATIKAATQAAVAIADAASDDKGQLSAAVISMLQSDIFNIMVQLQEVDATDDPAERVKLLSIAAKSAAELTRASITQKKHEVEIRAQERSRAAELATSAAKASGASDATLTAINDILGVKLG